MGISSFGISFYIILALSATTAGLGWLSLSLHDDKVVAESQLKDSLLAISNYQIALNLKDASFNVDDKSTVEFMQEKEEVREKIDNLVIKITNLKKGIAIAPSETETLKNAKTSTIYGDELLSLDLRLLLDQAYCLASPEDNLCRPTGQPPSGSVQGSTIR